MSSEGIARKKRIRGGHKSSATRMLTQIDTLLTEDPPDLARLSQLKLSIQEKLETIKLLDGELLDLVGEDELTSEIEQADAYKEGVFAAIIKIDKCIMAHPTPAPSDTRPRGSVDKVKLPKLVLRPFNGDITMWNTFWESYDSAVHRNRDLSEIDKFNYLNSLLTGTAREAVSGLSLTTAYYAEAVAILKKRFGNADRIKARHMDILMNIEPVTSSRDLKALRKLHDLVESHVRSLKALGVEADTYGSLLTSVILNKLPSDLQLIISRHSSEPHQDLIPLLKAIEEEIEARERVQPKPHLSQQRRTSEQQLPTATTLVSNTVPSVVSCCYCQQPHPSGTCTTVTQVDARRQILKRSGRCFCCLKRGHLGRDCRSTVKCPVCNGRHHRSICTKGQPQHRQPSTGATNVPNRTPGTSDSNQSGSGQSNTEAPTTLTTVPPTSTLLYVSANKAVFLQTAQTEIYNPFDPQLLMTVRVILDSGSQRSYVNHKVKGLLDLKPETLQQLSIATFGAGKENRLCETVRVGMKMKHGTDQEFKVIVVPQICEPITPQPLSVCVESCEHLSQLELADPGSNIPLEVDVLIGSDYYWELTTGEIRRGTTGPVAIRTKLGWVLSGPSPSIHMEIPVVSLITAHTLTIGTESISNSELNNRLHSFWELESLGIEKDNKSLHDTFKENILFKDGRYEVSLPWKEFHDHLPDNYMLSLRRLEGLMKRLKQTPEILKEYNATIQDQIDKGIVEVVPDARIAQEGRVHYLPHHAVIRHDKATTKLRVVYDASARAGGPSLNDCLYTGPKFNQRIFDILIRFRAYRTAITADIEKAFLMVSIKPSDRNALRFLWYDDLQSEEPKVTVLRFTRVVFGVSSSPFLLNATVQYHLEKFSSVYPELVSRILHSLYVDDLVCGADSEHEAQELFETSRRLLRSGSFNLRKFKTNSPQLQEVINKVEGGRQSDCPEETYTKSTVGPQCPPHSGGQKILGVYWDIPSDSFLFNFDEVASLASRVEPTKRNIVSVVSRFYDPLGIISPITVRFKIFIQKLCDSVAEWDQLIAGDNLQKWHSLVAELQGVPAVSIPRYLFDDVEYASYELWGFCDASMAAYAAVVYIVAKGSTGELVRFVTSKTRVAPIQTQTIPRLELLSALLLARLITSVSHSLGSQLTLAPPKCFTDSRVALYWIQGIHKEWKQFVQNRVNEIRRLVPSDHWIHCRGQNNPADIPSRGATVKELIGNSLWWNGPQDTSCLVSSNIEELAMPKECATEMKAKDVVTHSLLTPHPSADINLQRLIVCEDYSKLARLLRVTTYVLRFVRLLKTKTEYTGTPGLPTPGEIAEAERLWVIQSQSQLVNDRHFDEWRKQFDLFCDERGILRCGGRLTNSDLQYATNHPIFLSKQNHLAVLITRQAHEKVLHNGVKDTLTEIRTKYWVVKGRSLVKSIVQRCVLCKKFEGRPHRLPPPPPLPEFRVTEAPPFSSTGVDFAGPLYVKTHGLTRSKKVWICLYTCCVTRAVSIDIVPDLSTDTFIRSLKRFCARRGLPRLFISDNGKTFKAASRVIKDIINNEDVKQYLSNVRVEWSFNLAKAPWWGGIFERLIRSMKRCLRKVIGQAKLSYDELLTAVTEIESIINSRPLSYVAPDDLEEPLTPSHLLMGRRVLSLPDNLSYQGDTQDPDFELNPADLTRRVKHLNNSLTRFWRRWRHEYLVELREAHRFNSRTPAGAPIAANDLVIVHNESLPRGFWKIAKVESTITGQDGKIRGANLRVSSTDGKTITLQRPVSLLYPLEINCQDGSTNMERTEETQPRTNDSLGEPTGEGPVSRRPTRAAASRAVDQMRRWVGLLDEGL